MKRKRGRPAAITTSPNPIARCSSCAPSAACLVSKDRELPIALGVGFLPAHHSKTRSSDGSKTPRLRLRPSIGVRSSFDFGHEINNRYIGSPVWGMVSEINRRGEKAALVCCPKKIKEAHG